MDEYIKRETAVKMVMAAKWGDGSDGAMAMEIVASAPTADVTPVVRCKHCTDGIMSNDNKYIICCRLGVGMEFDDFCSHGEKKDEGISYVAD